MSAPLDLRFGRWEDVLADVTCDSVITDPPYGARTHKGARTTKDLTSAGHGIGYDSWNAAAVTAFVESWAPRTRRWLVAMTSHDLIPAWEAAFKAAKLYGFAPVPAIVNGMGVRIAGDGPASWGIYVMAARHTQKRAMKYTGQPEGAMWRALPGGYAEAADTSSSGGGRGKPAWLTHALVRDYSNPGDLVCDPMAGWGTTLTAALALNRRIVGAEMEAEAFARAQLALERPL
ncbi:MAG: DNA methyltransferase, partial [Alsobacter sp.]